MSAWATMQNIFRHLLGVVVNEISPVVVNAVYKWWCSSLCCNSSVLHKNGKLMITQLTVWVMNARTWKYGMCFCHRIIEDCLVLPNVDYFSETKKCEGHYSHNGLLLHCRFVWTNTYKICTKVGKLCGEICIIIEWCLFLVTIFQHCLWPLLYQDYE